MRRTNKKTDSEYFCIKDHEFRYDCDYDYSTESHCEEYGCHSEGICRCSTIHDAHVESVNIDLHNFIESNYKEKFSDIDKYCIERIMSHYGIWNKENYEVSVCGGYYGEEIGGVTFTPAAECDKAILDMWLLRPNSKKIEYVLKMEYGFILDKIKNKQWSIQTIDRDSVVVGQTDHYKKLNKEAQERYKDWKFPVAVVLKKGKKYSLIDGYHRFSQANQKQISVIVGKD